MRSIPARAGEPICATGKYHRRRVYPRACGGTVSLATTSPRSSGLSPRVRGNLNRPRLTMPTVGSIPARAGEPRRTHMAMPRCWVYPRACGGTLGIPDNWKDMQGLSPRVRGNREYHLPDNAAIGSIPARAGEPHSAQASKRASSVYPRACGGTSDSRIAPHCRLGLSPRVRGNLSERTATNILEGSIPARAGEPPTE